jgi:predicted Zn-dependent peptidase
MKSFQRIAAAAALGLFITTGMAMAQTTAYDSSKFWQELQDRGGQLPAAFDRQKFFQELENQGGQSMDPKKFFEELERRGAALPASFDAQKFFEDLQNKGAKIPPMVKMK